MSAFEIEVSGEFSAAHALKLYDGTYEPRHGHDWKVAVAVRAERLDSIGVVLDFEALKPALARVLERLDGRHLNDQRPFSGGAVNPSTENIARHIHDELAGAVADARARITRVTVWETPDASASYCP